MAWDETLTKLNSVLARLYSTKESSYRIVNMAGLSSALIAFRDAPIENWYSILDQAAKQGKVLSIIQAARTDYPEDQDLAAAEQVVRNRRLALAASESLVPASRRRAVVATTIAAVLVAVAFIIALLWTWGTDCGEQLSDVFSYIRRAQMHRDKGAYACADRDFEAGFPLATSNADRARLYYGRATIALARNRPDDAHDLSQDGLRVDPIGEPLLYLSDGLALCMLNDTTTAAGKLKIFLDRDRASDVSSARIGDLYADLDAGRGVAQDCFLLSLELP